MNYNIYIILNMTINIAKYSQTNKGFFQFLIQNESWDFWGKSVILIQILNVIFTKQKKKTRKILLKTKSYVTIFPPKIGQLNHSLYEQGNTPKWQFYFLCV